MSQDYGKEITWGGIRIILMLAGAISCGQAQVAITEVMSYASASLGSTYVSPSPDWFEVTNFGTNEVDLSEYSFLDADKLFPDQAANIFQGVVVGPKKSIIFVRTNSWISSYEAFFNHWGNVNTCTQVVCYPREYGFDEYSDAVLLLDAEKNLLQAAEFSQAWRGHTFTYDTNTGDFGVISETNGCGVIKAVRADDYGSPGTTCGPVPMKIESQSESFVKQPGEEVCLKVKVNGLPRPRYQWYHDGMPISGAKSECLRIDPVEPEDAGQYWVTLDNGLETDRSEQMTLTVNTSNAPPTLFCDPATNRVSKGQSAVFAVRAVGFPRPNYQWFFKAGTNSDTMSEPISTNQFLTIPPDKLESEGIYTVTVRATNRWGTNTASAVLIVQPKPCLIISEVMNETSTNSPYGVDWWELTNLEDYAVNLRGYRWDDIDVTYESISHLPFAAEPCQTCCPRRTGIATVTDDIIIKPGESIIFVERLSRAEFMDWWGHTNLCSDLQVITYVGNGLGVEGEVITVWDASATELTDRVTKAGFSTADPGVSWWFPPLDSESELPKKSVVGEEGAICAAKGGDIGSPGKYRWSPCLRVVRQEASGVMLVWDAEPSATYTIKYKDNLWQSDWQLLSPVMSREALGTYTIPAFSGKQRFYRIFRNPPK